MILLTVDLPKNCWMSGKQYRPLSDAASDLGLYFILFAQDCLSQNLRLS